MGVLLGLAGVGVLAGVEPVGGLPAVVGIVATTTASLCYAAGTLYTQIKLEAWRSDRGWRGDAERPSRSAFAP